MVKFLFGVLIGFGLKMAYDFFQEERIPDGPRHGPGALGGDPGRDPSARTRDPRGDPLGHRAKRLGREQQRVKRQRLTSPKLEEHRGRHSGRAPIGRACPEGEGGRPGGSTASGWGPSPGCEEIPASSSIARRSCGSSPRWRSSSVRSASKSGWTPCLSMTAPEGATSRGSSPESPSRPRAAAAWPCPTLPAVRRRRSARRTP